MERYFLYVVEEDGCQVADGMHQSMLGRSQILFDMSRIVDAADPPEMKGQHNDPDMCLNGVFGCQMVADVGCLETCLASRNVGWHNVCRFVIESQDSLIREDQIVAVKKYGQTAGGMNPIVVTVYQAVPAGSYPHATGSLAVVDVHLFVVSKLAVVDVSQVVLDGC